jgi:hypothetical protein
MEEAFSGVPDICAIIIAKMYVMPSADVFDLTIYLCFGRYIVNGSG